jgi:hypothetical protein
MSASLSAIAKRFDFVRETGGPNRGAWVEWFLRFTGNQPGESWCASFESRCEDIAYGQCITPKSASCQDKLDWAVRKGRVVREPAVDDLVFSINAQGRAHHIAIVSGTSPLTAVAGNTDEFGVSDNGTGVYDHAISREGKIFVRLPQ